MAKVFRNSTLLLLMILLLGIKLLTAQTTLSLTVSKQQFYPGDTLVLTCTVPEWENTQRLGTVNIMMEDLNHRHQWKMRYPMVEGYFEAVLILPDNFPEGLYIITGELQPVFFQLTGRMTNRVKEDSLRYTLQLEDKTIIAGTIGLSKEGAFRMPRHVFSGRATLFYSAYKPTKGKNQVDVTITTLLDSAYKPIAQASIQLPIGDVDNVTGPNLYSIDSNLMRNQQKGTLDNVTVKGRAITKIDKIDEEYSSGYFKGDRATVFGGLDGEFSGFVTILDYLHGRVAGLNVSKNTEEFGQYQVTWRNEPTAFFIDEIPVDLESIYNFPPSEIAMLKVFPPPFQGVILGAGGGAIAIYSKRATLGLQPRYRNRFVIQGFSPTTIKLRKAIP
jgi:hypothetical protein